MAFSDVEGLMKHFIGPLVLAMTVTSSAWAQAPQQQSGAFLTYKNSQRLTTETYSIASKPGGILETRATIEAPGQPPVKVTTRISANKPLSFSEESGGAKLFSADFGASGMKLEIPGRPNTQKASNATILLENLVWHHYIFLLSQYDGSKGGRQEFIAGLPSEAKDFGIIVARKDSPSFDLGDRIIKTDHYILTASASLQIEVWADQSRIPLLILIESQGLKVIHQGSEGLVEAIFAAQTAEAAAPANRFSTEEVSFKNRDITLAGTLAIPQNGAARHPAVIVISGSGPQDRDGNPGGYFIFKLIAEQLASHGIAVLRHDDRGVGKSSVPAKPTTYHDLIDDTRAAIVYLRARSDIDQNRIGLVGHSEGGFTASIIAAGDSKIAAIALLAGAALANFEILLNEQVLYDLALQRQIDPSDHSLEQPIVHLLRTQLEEARAGKPDVKMTDGHEYFRQHLALDMADVYARIHCPVLILQGERDTNVLALHAVQVALKFSSLGNKNVRLRIVPDVDHAFVPSPLDKCSPGEKRIQLNQDFLNTLERWATSVLVTTSR
jgi:dipeptidyl aminopeptidase/acylaminoacyl peptidase